MEAVTFVDAHVHLWNLDHLRYPWLTPPFGTDGPNGNVAPIARNYLLADYLAEAAEWAPAGFVHVDAGVEPAAALAETDWLESIAVETGMPNAIVAFAPLDHPDAERLLAAQAARPHVRGIRQIVNWHADPARTYCARDLTRDPAWQAGFALLGRFGFSFDLQAYPGQFAGLAPLIERCPETPVILDHAGMGIDGEADWEAGMRALAALPNVSVKISGMGFVFRALDRIAIRRRVLRTIELFGTDRAMFASDFPTDRLFGAFGETMTMLADAVADFSLEERRGLFGRNANRIYRLGLDL